MSLTPQDIEDLLFILQRHHWRKRARKLIEAMHVRLNPDGPLGRRIVGRMATRLATKRFAPCDSKLLQL